MISYKVLIILTVIFDIICCNGPVDECIKISEKVGFILSDTGFYNYNFVQQFADYTEFIKHVETRINTSSDDNVTLPKEFGNADVTMDTSDDPKSISRKRKNIDNDVTLPESIRYLQTFYFSIRKSNSHAIIVNPYQYCTVRVKESVKYPETTFQYMRNRFLAHVMKQSFQVDEINRQRDLLSEGIVEPIKACEKQILDFQLKIEDRIFKYDEYNAHKNILTSYEMALLKDPNNGTIGSLELKFEPGTIGSLDLNSEPAGTSNSSDVYDFGKNLAGSYFRYHLTLFGDFFNTLQMLTTPKLCKSYFPKNNEDD